MTPPVWSGSGKDPWLPERLDARLNAGQAERAIRTAYWAALSGWLVETSRRVTRGQTPDLDAIWARAPAWRTAVEQVIDGAVRPAMAAGYARLLGQGYPWEQRPFVSGYLAEVTNRMVRVPDEVYDLVAGQVSQAVNLGEGIPQIADRVDNVLSTTATERWPNRAVVTARTETMGSLNSSRLDAFKAVAEETGDPFEKVWLATVGPRTRPTHASADGQSVPVTDPFVVGGYELDFPGDPGGPAEEVIQCVTEDTDVWFPSVRAVMRRWYEGQMITIRLAGGDQLTITPNHPVLRVDGRWVPAGQLVKGDYCVRAGLSRQLAGQPDVDHPPTKISEFYRSACLVSVAQRIPLSPPDLHGDRPYGDVEVVPVHGELAFHGESAGDEEIRQFGLSVARAARVSLGGVDRGTVPHHVESASDSLDALPRVVALDKIVKIDRHPFIGHVYNLDTGQGWYISETIVTRNCRCSMLLVEPGETTDMSNRQFLGQ